MGTRTRARACARARMGARMCMRVCAGFARGKTGCMVTMLGYMLQVTTIKAKKGREFRDLKPEIASTFNAEPDQMRLWYWSKRSNNTYRPSRPLAPNEESQRVESLSELLHSPAYNKGALHNVNFFLEVPTDPGKPLPPLTEKGQFFLFFKFYDPAKETLSVPPLFPIFRWRACLTQICCGGTTSKVY